MKILIVTTEIGLNGGGMSLSCTKLAEVLFKNHIVEIIDSSQMPIYTALGGKISRLGNSIQMEYKLKTETLKYKGFDVVIGFGGKFNGYYAALLAKQIRAKYILCLRGSDINLSKWSVEDSWFIREASMRAGNIVCLSKEMKNNILLINPTICDKVVIIPNAIEGECVMVNFPNLPTSVVLGCAASHLNEKKGVKNLLYMISEFKKISDISIKLILVGYIDEDLKKEYIRTIELLDLQPNIEFHGKTSRNILASKMKDWDFYVQGSVCEGHPNSVIEALQNGCAFFSSKTGFIAEILSSEYPDLFFEEWTPQSMAYSLRNLILISDKESIYKKAYENLQQHCNSHIIVEKWNQLLTANKNRQTAMSIEHVIAVGLHDVQGTLHDSITTPVDVFDKFVKQIYSSGYGLCSMKDYLAKDLETRKYWIVCTFDDGYKGLNDFAMPILNQYGFTATVFVCTSLIGKDNKWNNKDSILRKHLNFNELQNLKSHGWEIASHGVSHLNLLKLSDDELVYELEQSHNFIIKQWGESLTYAYPYGAYNEYIKKCVGKYYKFAFSVTQGGTSLVADALQIKRYSIAEIRQMLLMEK